MRKQQQGCRPRHPGQVLREEVLPALAMTQVELARRLGVSRVTVSDLLCGRRGMSVLMAARLAKLLGTSTQCWLHMQVALEVWEIEQQPQLLGDVRPLRSAWRQSDDVRTAV